MLIAVVAVAMVLGACCFIVFALSVAEANRRGPSDAETAAVQAEVDAAFDAAGERAFWASWDGAA